MSNTITDSLNFNEILSFKSLLLKIVGVVAATVAIKGFMIPNHFLDGGLLGISILIHEIYHIDVWIPLLLLNIPFVIIGYNVGRNGNGHGFFMRFYFVKSASAS